MRIWPWRENGVGKNERGYSRKKGDSKREQGLEKYDEAWVACDQVETEGDPSF